MITLSVIKADTGGFVGHSAVHPRLVAEARREIERAKSAGLLVDGCVESCGDDISLIMTHTYGPEAGLIHSFAWDTFQATTHIAKDLGLYGAGQDLLSDAFSGNLRGMGPGYAELEFEERPSELVLCFLADKTEPGAWNLPLYKMFADPSNTAGLVIDEKMHAGFAFEVHDLHEDRRIVFDCPADLYDMLMYIGAPVPVPVGQAHPSRFDRPPRVVALGFQIKDGRLVGPRDMFDDPAFDGARRQATEVMDYLRRHGPFEPHRLPLEDLEYTTMASLTKRLAHRWTPITTEVATPAGL
ncbi:fructose-1,6-bisphosphatase [Microbispora sp. NBC_01389]